MKKIKIAFCLRDMQMGGVESVLLRTIDALKKYKNIEVSLITYAKISENFYVNYFKQHTEIKVHSLYPCKWLGTKLPHFFLWRLGVIFMRGLYRGIKRQIFGLRAFKDIDVFIDYHDFGFADELKNVNFAKKIAWCHSSINTFIKRDFIKFVKYYDKLVVLTDDFKNDFVKRYPNFANKVVRVYNPVDIKKLQVMAGKADKVKLKKYFCCVSRLTPDKDIKTVLSGFDMFWKNNKKPDVKMVFVGDGNLADEYKCFAEKLSAKNQFVFVGKLSNPFGVMKNALANVLSSFSEGLPTVLIESSAVGVLNISSDCKCGPREILLGGYGGLLFKSGDAVGLAKCFDDVYNKKVDIKKMVKESTKELKRFDSNTIAKDFISLLS